MRQHEKLSVTKPLPTPGIRGRLRRLAAQRRVRLDHHRRGFCESSTVAKRLASSAVVFVFSIVPACGQKSAQQQAMTWLTEFKKAALTRNVDALDRLFAGDGWLPRIAVRLSAMRASLDRSHDTCAATLGHRRHERQ